MWPGVVLAILALVEPSLARTPCSDGSRCLNLTLSVAPALGSCHCSEHAFCYLGACLCHPGYDPSSNCSRKLHRLNPWMKRGCLALQSEVTFAADMAVSSIGGEYHRDGSLCPKFMRYCAYLCFAHVSYGVAVVPRSLWHQAQTAELSLWTEISRSSFMDPSANDRAEEHWLAFDYLSCLPRGTSLGSVVGEKFQDMRLSLTVTF